MKRRSFAKYCLGVLICIFLMLGLGVAAMAAEANFPTRPITLIVPSMPGSSTDMMARIASDAAGPFLGQKVVIVNKPGGGGTIGTAAIVWSTADGYTIGSIWNAPLTMVPHVDPNVSYTVDDFGLCARR